MYIHIGKTLFGKCDVVPELFHVETIFLHVDYLPLVPLQTYLITRKVGKQFTGVKMRLSTKSLFYAWSRVATFLGAVGLSVAALVAIDDLKRGDSRPLVNQAVLAAACWLAFGALMLYPRRIKPRYERTCQLASLAKLSDVGWAALNVQYGREIDERPDAKQPT